MKIIIYLTIFLIFAAPATGQLTRDQLPREISRQISDTQLELTNWMMFYYQNPVPEEFSDWLKKASAEGMFKDEKRQFPLLGFLATVFATNSDKISQWMNTIDSLPEPERKMVLIALWLSGTKVSQEYLSGARRELLNGQNYFRLQTAREPPSMNDINIYWGFLDIQWGRFCASGKEEPIKNVISVLDFAQFMGSRQKYPNPKNDAEKRAILKEATFQSALWSLRSNCQMHPKVLAICERTYNEGKLSRLAQLSLKTILIKLKPDKYKIEEPSNKANSADAKSRAAD